MPDAPASARRFGGPTISTLTARLIAFGGALALTGYGIWQMYRVVIASQVTLLEWVFVVFFGVTFGWIAFSASSAVAGIVAMLGATPGTRSAATSDAGGNAPDADGAPGETHGKVVIIMPIYNENPAETCAALQTMAQDLDAKGQAHGVEIFLLSDTTRADVWLEETATFDVLRSALENIMPVWYRRRRFNTARKAGNVRDFVERWGARYESMIVLDADSLLAADALIALMQGMRADPALGILQSVPAIAGGGSLFARLQQFAGSVYGPVVSRGLAAWQGDEGNYWGHNAIIRLAAFAEASGLPTLPGRRPLGGDIMSHDFVEAALVRKAGWKVCMLPALRGSWENGPPSLLDVAVRDRRWAQGNIQHLAVWRSRGMAWPSRVHFMIGVMSYASSALWLAMILIGLALSLQAALVQPEYFPDYATLFPNWPVFDNERMVQLFIVSMIVLLIPKFVGTVHVLLDRARCRSQGGLSRFLGSVCLEIVLSALYAPILMVLQTRQLWEIVRGQDSGWNLQQRSSASIPWAVVWRRHWFHCLLGLLLTIALAFLSPTLLPWMSPVILGLVLAPALSRWSAQVSIGRWLADRGLLLIPEETQPPPQFAEQAAALPVYAEATTQASVAALFADPPARARHFKATLPDRQHRRGIPDVVKLATRAKVDDAHATDELLEWLEQDELMVLLGDRELFAALAGKSGFAAEP